MTDVPTSGVMFDAFADDELLFIAARSHVCRMEFGSSPGVVDTMCSMMENRHSEYDGHRICGAPPDRAPRQAFVIVSPC